MGWKLNVQDCLKTMCYNVYLIFVFGITIRFNIIKVNVSRFNSLLLISLLKLKKKNNKEGNAIDIITTPG